VPTILRKDGFRFFFYSNERNEPPHVHVIGKGGELKVWLEPIKLARAFHISKHDQTAALRLVEENVSLFLRSWKNWHESNR
jgi:hypothetical protein